MDCNLNNYMSDFKVRNISVAGKIGIGTAIPQSALHVSSGFIEENSINTCGANFIIEATSTTRTIGQGVALGFVLPAFVDGSHPWQQGRILVTPDNTLNQNASGRMYIQTRV